MDILKQTIAHRDGEVKGLFTQIQSQEALLQRALSQPVQATKPDAARELEVEEEMQRLTIEVSELRTKLIQAEDEKLEAQRQLEAGQLATRLLRDFMCEIKPNPPPIPPKPARKPPPIPPKPVEKPTQKPVQKLALLEVSQIIYFVLQHPV